MKKIVSLLLVLVMSLGLFAACGQSEAENTFTVGFDAEYPPYGFMDENGEYTGFDLDLAQEVCNRRGWTLVKQPIDWNAKDNELNAGNIDCIWNGFTRNEERENQYAWSDYYVNNSIVLLVRKDSGFKTKADLAGKVVDVQAASSGADALEKDAEFKATLKNVIEVKDYNTAVMDLQSGAVDAVVIDIGVADYQCEIHDDIMIMEEAVNTEKYAIGFQKDNTALRDQVQETLYEMLEDGTFAKSIHGVGCPKFSYWFNIQGSKGNMETAREITGERTFDTLYTEIDAFEGEHLEGSDKRIRKYKPTGFNPEMDAKFGHAGGDFYTMYYFCERILGDENAETIDIYEACDMFLPGLFAYKSILAGNMPMQIPNFRDPAEREKWRHDTSCTDPAAAGDMLLPSYSKGTPEIPNEVYDRLRDMLENPQD